MTTDLLEVALDALTICAPALRHAMAVMPKDDPFYRATELTEKSARKAISALEAAKLEAKPTCTCGHPSSLGIVHRRHLPCFVYEDQPVGIPAGMRAQLREIAKTLDADGDEHGCAAKLWDILAAPALPVEPPITERESIWLTLKEDLNPHTVNLVVRFARAMAKKLAAAEKKYGYTDGWASPDWMDECRAKLLEHIAKGDPRDVAAYCMFLWHHGEKTALPAAPAVELPVWIPVDRLPEKCAIYRVLVMLGNGNKCVSLGYWDGEGWQRVHEAGEYQDHEPYFDDYDMKVTDWKPLPDESESLAGSKS